MKKNILIVEDDDLLRLGIKSIINSREGFHTIEETGDGLMAIELFNKVKPDVVLLDLYIKSVCGIEVLRQMKESNPSIPVVILTGNAEDKNIYMSLQNGANAYVLKDASEKDLFFAINYAIAGFLFISPKLLDRVVRAYITVYEKCKEYPALNTLTAREKEVAHLVIQGKKSQQIADQLYISIKTVNKHRSNIIKKLGIRNLSDLRRDSVYLFSCD